MMEIKSKVTLNDLANTRVVTSAITSYSIDQEIDYSQNKSIPTIIMTLGSAIRVLRYKDKESRNKDVALFDDYL